MDFLERAILCEIWP